MAGRRSNIALVTQKRRWNRSFLRIVRRWWCILLLFGMPGVAQAQTNTDMVMAIGKNALYYDDFVLAIRYFSQVIDAKPFLAEPYYYRGLAKFYLEDYVGAADDCSRSIERNPFVTQVYQLRAVCYIQQGRFDDAAADYTRVLKGDADNVSVWYNRVLCHMESKENDVAEREVDSLIARWPKYAKAYGVKAQICFNRKDSVAGLDWLSRSLRLDANNPEAWAFVGGYQLQKEHYKAADSCLTQAIHYAPDRVAYYLDRAIARYKLNRFADVLADYDKAIELDSRNFVAHYNRGLLRAEVGDRNRAIEDFNVVLQQEPSNMLARLNRAQLRQATGDFRGAVRDYTVILRSYPDFLYGYSERAQCYRKLGNTRAALSDERRVYVRQIDQFLSNTSHNRHLRKVRKRSDLALESYQQPVVEDRADTMQVYRRMERGKVQNRKVTEESYGMFVFSFAPDMSVPGRNPLFLQSLEAVNRSQATSARIYLTTQHKSLSHNEMEQLFARQEELNEQLQSRPTAEGYFVRSVVRQALQDDAGAMADIEQALRLSPQMEVAWMMKAALMWRQWQSSAAEKKDLAVLQPLLQWLERAEQRFPRNAYLRYNRACVLQQAGQASMALQEYGNALKLLPDLAEAYYNRGLLFLHAGQTEAGLADLRKAGELGLYNAYSLLKQHNQKKTIEP